jgi:uncharacterized protein (TIGR02444 family)
MKTSGSHQSLWSFALAFYARPGVAETCLFLQDRHKANVCLLIGLRWLDTQRLNLTSEDWQDLLDYTQRWTREIVAPLRKLRRSLKQPFNSFVVDDLHNQIRETIKQAELLAEKKLLEEIERWSKEKLTGHRTCHGTNLEKYLADLGAEGNIIDSLQQTVS